MTHPKINKQHLENVLERKRFRTKSEDDNAIETQMLNHKVSHSVYPAKYKLKDQIKADLMANQEARKHLCTQMGVDMPTLTYHLRNDTQTITQMRWHVMFVSALGLNADAEIYEPLT